MYKPPFANSKPATCWARLCSFPSPGPGAVVTGSPEPLFEALPPARIPKLPAELTLGLGVRGSPRLGHHERRRLPCRQASQPARNAPWWLRIQGVRQYRQPVAHRRRLVVDDVVDARPAVIDCGHRRRRGVIDVDVREDPSSIADDGEPAL